MGAKRVETVGVYPLAPPLWYDELLAESQRKTLRPDRVNRLRGSSPPANLQKRLPPRQDVLLTQLIYPAKSLQKKRKSSNFRCC